MSYELFAFILFIWTMLSIPASLIVAQLLKRSKNYMSAEQGYWNGLPTKVRRVVGTVRPHDPETDPPLAWWRDIVGQRIAAVEVVLDGVNYGGGVDYLDDRDGSGWWKVTVGRGSPRYGHSNVPLIDVEAHYANGKNVII